MSSLSSAKRRPYKNQISEAIQPFSTEGTLTTSDTQLYQINVTNTTGIAKTFTIVATPTYFPGVFILAEYSIGGNATIIIHWPEGLWCEGGLAYGASDTGLEGAVAAWYK